MKEKGWLEFNSMICELIPPAYPSIKNLLIKYNSGLEDGLGYQNCQNRMEYGLI